MKLTISSAFGHPLGCTGARQVVTALSELRRQNKRIAVTSMCVGTVRSPSRLVHPAGAEFQSNNVFIGHGHGWYLRL